jgi:hypothetical protein
MAARHDALDHVLLDAAKMVEAEDAVEEFLNCTHRRFQ